MDFSKEILERLSLYLTKPHNRGHAHMYYKCTGLPHGVYVLGNTKLEDFGYAHPPMAYCIVDLRKQPDLIEALEAILQTLPMGGYGGDLIITSVLSWCKANKSFDLSTVAKADPLHLQIRLMIRDKPPKIFDCLQDFFTASVIDRTARNFLKVMERGYKEILIDCPPVTKVMMVPCPPIDTICPNMRFEGAYSLLFVRGTDTIEDADLIKKGETAKAQIVLWSPDGHHVDYGMVYRGEKVTVMAAKAYGHLFPTARLRVEKKNPS